MRRYVCAIFGVTYYQVPVPVTGSFTECKEWCETVFGPTYNDVRLQERWYSIEELQHTADTLTKGAFLDTRHFPFDMVSGSFFFRYEDDLNWFTLRWL